MRKTKDLDNNLDKKFIRSVESVFDPDFSVYQDFEDQYYNIVVQPELERQRDMEWERFQANAD